MLLLLLFVDEVHKGQKEGGVFVHVCFMLWDMKYHLDFPDEVIHLGRIKKTKSSLKASIQSIYG